MSKDLRSVLLFAFHFPPANASGSARPYRWYRYLPECGYQPYVITSAPAADFPNVISVPANTGKPDKTTVSGLSEAVLRKFIFPYDDAMLWTLQAYNAAKQLATRVHFSAVISTFPPINTHLAAYRFSNEKSIPWIADFRDPLWRKGIRDSPGLPGLVDRELERRFVQLASVVVNTTDTLHEDTSARHRYAQHKFQLIWNGYDPSEDLSALPVAPGKRTLLHAGNLYYARRPSVLIDALYRLVQNSRLNADDILVRFVGHVDDAILKDQPAQFDYLQSRGVVRFESLLPRDKALLAVRQAHSLLLLDMSGGDLVPAKLFEYARAGRPILAFTEKTSPVAKILEGSGLDHRIIFPDDSADRVDQELIEFFHAPIEPRATSEWFRNEFDGRRSTARLAHLIDDVIARQTVVAAAQ